MNEAVKVADAKKRKKNSISKDEIIMSAGQQDVANRGKVRIRKLAYDFFKRFFDIVCGLIGVIFLVPLIIIIKIVSMISGDFKTIFYYQRRVGKNGKEFRLYKFRSMVPNSDEVLKRILNTNKKMAKEWKENQKFENDPRITKIGNILRKTSLDEVPQFINILKGDMSMIGPRPLIPGELDRHKGNHAIYESVRPGITGWWACNGRGSTTYEERLDLEYYYVRNRGLWLDIKCVFKTISAVITKKGAK